MAIGQILQDALVRANDTRIEQLEKVKTLECSLLRLKKDLQQAQKIKATADERYAKLDAQHRELLEYSESLSDNGAREALIPQLEFLMQQMTDELSNTQRATEDVSFSEQQVKQFEELLLDEQDKLQLATHKWDQLRKQLDTIRYSSSGVGKAN